MVLLVPSSFSGPLALSLVLYSLSSHPLIAALVTEGDVTTFAGLASSSGSINGVGSNARFNNPRGVSVSSDGSYALVADYTTHIIRQIVLSTATVSMTGVATTAGSTDGVGSNARFHNPFGVSISPDGSYALVADGNNHIIRHIVLSTASVSTLAGVGSSSGSTNGVGSNALFNNPFGVSVSSDGSYALVADTNNQLIRKIIISTATVSTLTGVVGTAGSTNGGSNSRFYWPHGVSISLDGSFALVADTNNQLIRHIIISTATVSTLAGASAGSTNGVGSNAKFNYPRGVSASPDGSYGLVADQSNHLIRQIIISTASVSLLHSGRGGLILWLHRWSGLQCPI
jgi:DNA-binding beta-propeller fold protein YncE